MSYDDREPVEATVAELKPRMKNVTITFKVMETGEEREVTSRDSGDSHRVLDAVVGDSTAVVSVPLWDANIDEVEIGSTYTLKNGYTGLYRGNLRLNIGKYGELAEAKDAIDEVNMDLDMSAEEHEDTRRRSYGGGGGGGRSGGGYGNRDRSSSYGSRDFSSGYRTRESRGSGYGGNRDNRRRY
ncbi:MAG: hypothetical protein EAX95_01225 [Candidatus Thorarchaeota archaeon]|nr:hypothetical protein [Candidatus Thorarchaeota archaeon]